MDPDYLAALNQWLAGANPQGGSQPPTGDQLSAAGQNGQTEQQADWPDAWIGPSAEPTPQDYADALEALPALAAGAAGPTDGSAPGHGEAPPAGAGQGDSQQPLSSHVPGGSPGADGDPNLVLVSSRYPPVPPANQAPWPRTPAPARSRPGPAFIAPSGEGEGAGGAANLLDNLEQFAAGPEYDHAMNVKSDMQDLRKNNGEPTTGQGFFRDTNGTGVTADTMTFSDPERTTFVKLPSFGPEGYSVYEFKQGRKGQVWTSGDGNWRDMNTDPPFIRPAVLSPLK